MHAHKTRKLKTSEYSNTEDDDIMNMWTGLVKSNAFEFHIRIFLQFGGLDEIYFAEQSIYIYYTYI